MWYHGADGDRLGDGGPLLGLGLALFLVILSQNLLEIRWSRNFYLA